MTIDVLTLNAYLEENQTLLNSGEYTAAYSAAYATAYSSGCIAAASSFLQSQINQTPCNVSLWCSIPMMTGGVTGTVLVCDTSGYFRCGASCSWTVPNGITCAQFQMWGAGGGSNAGCCCGGANNGGTGAYVSVIMPVTAGTVYTLCAGCATCCYPTPGSSYCGRGCASYVTGTGMCNVCAEGGANFHWQSILDQGCYGSAGGGYWCTIEYYPNSGTTAGPCVCGSNNYCSNSCATCGEVVVHRNSLVNFYGCATNGKLMGIPGLHGGLCLDTNQYGHFTNPPVINTTHTGAFDSASNCGCRVCFTSENNLGGCLCSGGINGTSVQQFPGAGGFAHHAMGGNTTGCGDAGRMGMVRVTYR